MATEQRSGFRLPWASDARSETPDDTATPTADHPEPAADGSPTGESHPEATEMQETSERNDPRGSLSWPDEAAGGADDPPAPSTEAGRDPEPAPVPAARARRDNPLVAGLVRAMRDAATTAREETAARFTEAAKARVETIHAESADEAASLRSQADDEIQGIREWSKAEVARIREETDRRIADRKERLTAEVEDHAARVEHRIERVQAAVAEFERRMDAFFDQLLAEEDPARLAALAEQLPEPPTLEADVRDGWTPPARPVPALDAEGAAEAEAEALADLADIADDAAADADEGQPEDGPTLEGALDAGEADVLLRLEAFTKAPVAEASTSHVAVTGLVSVASIAGFKRALARIAGVRSVTVASGPSGDFVFTVNHDPETDLASAVPAIEGYRPVITGDADGVLSVTAGDPETAK